MPENHHILVGKVFELFLDALGIAIQGTNAFVGFDPKGLFRYLYSDKATFDLDFSNWNVISRRWEYFLRLHSTACYECGEQTQY